MRPETRQSVQMAGQLSTVGLSFVFAIVIGFGGGHLLDGWLGSRPWFTFLGFFLGLAAGVINVYRILQIAGGPAAGVPPAPQRPPSAQPSTDPDPAEHRRPHLPRD